MIKIMGLIMIAILAAYLVRRYASSDLRDGRTKFMRDINKRTLAQREKNRDD